jgi:flagellar biosynthesis/type III secretory pathway chaperone
LAEALFDPPAHLVLEREAVRYFVDILQREQSALQHGDIAALDTLVQEKTHQLERLARLGDERHNWLAMQGQGTGHEDMERGLRAYPGADAVWRELLDLARTAMQLNKLNGWLTGWHMRHNGQRLKAVRAAVQPVNLYGSDGQSRIARSGYSLGEG